MTWCFHFLANSLQVTTFVSVQEYLLRCPNFFPLMIIAAILMVISLPARKWLRCECYWACNNLRQSISDFSSFTDSIFMLCSCLPYKLLFIPSLKILLIFALRLLAGVNRCGTSTQWVSLECVMKEWRILESINLIQATPFLHMYLAFYIQSVCTSLTIIYLFQAYDQFLNSGIIRWHFILLIHTSSIWLFLHYPYIILIFLLPLPF